MMVLHADRWQIASLPGKLRRDVVRVQVVNERHGLDSVDLEKIPHDPLEGAQRFGCSHVSDMLADENAPPDADRHGVLQMRTDREQGR